MLDKLKALWRGTSPAGATSEDHAVRRAVAALLAEAAALDGHVDPAESQRIEALLARRFGLDPQAAADLSAGGTTAAQAATELYAFARTVKDGLDYEARVEIVEMLWEVVYADGQLHDYEANLMRRLARLVYVEDRDCGAARKRALARLGLGDL